MSTYQHIDLFLTEFCNQSCYYCSGIKHNTPIQTEVDEEYFKYVLQLLPATKINLILLGGEPGLITNLVNIIKLIKNRKFDVTISSNSLIRETYPFILKSSFITYNEHLLMDIDETGIHKFADYEFFDENDLSNNNIIIVTPTFKQYASDDFIKRLTHKNTLFKSFNHRAGFIDGDVQDYSKVSNCSKSIPSPVINMVRRKIYHCSQQPVTSLSFDITQESIDRLFNGTLITDVPNYCKECRVPFR